MIFNLLFIFTVIVNVQCQIYTTPCQRSGPVILAAPPCASPVPVKPYEVQLPVRTPYEVMPVPSAPNTALGCLNPGVTKCGTISEVPLPTGLPLSNPFLPAASPVSAMAPFSPLLPPATCQSRCQYLRKIPIPPPCI